MLNNTHSRTSNGQLRTLLLAVIALFFSISASAQFLQLPGTTHGMGGGAEPALFSYSTATETFTATGNNSGLFETGVGLVADVTGTFSLTAQIDSSGEFTSGTYTWVGSIPDIGIVGNQTLASGEFSLANITDSDSGPIIQFFGPVGFLNSTLEAAIGPIVSIEWTGGGFAACPPFDGVLDNFTCDYTGEAMPFAFDVRLSPEPLHACCNTGFPGCVDPDISIAVCNNDAFCCDVRWDALCVDQVTTLVGDNCDCCTASTEAEGCFDPGPITPSVSMTGEMSPAMTRAIEDRQLYKSHPELFLGMDSTMTVVKAGSANLTQDTEVRVNHTKTLPRDLNLRATQISNFPSDSSTVVGDGAAPAGQIGFFWSVARGDSVTETIAIENVDGGQINRALFDFSVPLNSALNSVTWNVSINGTVVGSFTVPAMFTGQISQDYSFAPIINTVDSNYIIEFTLTDGVPTGDGAHTFGTDGVVQLVGDFTDEIADCVCELDAFCCSTRWDSLCVSEVEDFGCGLCEGCAAPAVPFGPFPGDAANLVLPDQDLFWNTALTSVINGSFETGRFTGWRADFYSPDNADANYWQVSTKLSGAFGNGYALDGLYAAENAFDGIAGSRYELSQEILIPHSATQALLTWSDRIQWDMKATGGATLARDYTVAVYPIEGSEPLAVVHHESLLPDTAGDTGYVTRSVDLLEHLPELNGQVVKLVWRQNVPESFTGPAHFALDDVTLYFNTFKEPVPETIRRGGSRSTEAREAFWQKQFAERMEAYTLVAKGTADPSSFYSTSKIDEVKTPVPPGFVLQAGGLIKKDQALVSTVGDLKPETEDAQRMLSGTLIDFDDVMASPAFNQVTRLTNEYQALGVVFMGPGGNDGGAILDESSSFDVTGQSSPNFLAFNSGAILADGGTPQPPETLLFDPPVSQVQAKVGVGFGAAGSVVMEAFNESGALVATQTATIASSELQVLRVEGDQIVRVVISATGLPFWVLDDLWFEPCPLTYDVQLGTVSGLLTPVPGCQAISETQCEIAPLTPGVEYFWQVTALTQGGVSVGPEWSFTVSGDTDNDGILDALDNCILVPNGPLIPDAGGNSQRDTDGDGYGNSCDPDISNTPGEAVVNFIDISQWTLFFNTACGDVDEDFNGDGFCNFEDYLLFPAYFMQPPGPSGLVSP